MTTNMGMDNDFAQDMSLNDTNNNNKYKQRRHVFHEDGPDPTFWNQSYFIPGISGKPRCLSDVERPSATKRTSARVSSSSTTRSANKEDLRSWCSPKALRKGLLESGFIQEKMSEQNKSKGGSLSSSNEGASSKEGWSSLPNVLHNKENTKNQKYQRSSSGDDTHNVEQDLQKLLQELRESRKQHKESE